MVRFRFRGIFTDVPKDLTVIENFGMIKCGVVFGFLTTISSWDQARISDMKGNAIVYARIVRNKIPRGWFRKPKYRDFVVGDVVFLFPKLKINKTETQQCEKGKEKNETETE